MSYYNWKTGRWATYNQCSQPPIMAEQELTLEKYGFEKIEEEAPPRSRTKQIFDAYMQFENRLCGRMLGKGYHLFAVALTSWLLRSVAICGIIYAFCKLIALVFQLYFIIIAFMFYDREMSGLDTFFWGAVAFFVIFIGCIIFFAHRLPDSPPSQNNESQPKPKPIRLDIREEKSFWTGRKTLVLKQRD